MEECSQQIQADYPCPLFISDTKSGLLHEGMSSSTRMILVFWNLTRATKLTGELEGAHHIRGEAESPVSVSPGQDIVDTLVLPADT